MAQRIRNRRRNQIDEDDEDEVMEDTGDRMTAAEELEAALNDPSMF